MKVEIFEDKEKTARATAALIIEQVKRKPDSLLCFPSGESPTATLHLLVESAQQGSVDFSRCQFVGLDEWVGMNEFDEGSCKHYLLTHFFSPLGISEDNIIFFDGLAEDPKAECDKMNRFIAEKGPIDLMLVGLGMNGHIGLNEPYTDFSLYAHVAELDPMTVQVAQKYFDKATALSGGLTLGLQHLLEANTVILIVNGEKKAGIVARLLAENISDQLPGTIVRSHRNSYLMLDAAAGSKIIQ